MYCIVGLGNAGSEYTLTRHNVGFQVLDELAAETHVAFHPGKGEYWTANCSLNNKSVALVKPVTFMNNSGIAVQEFLEQHEVLLEHVLVVCDDFQLPLGTIRIRQSGTDGGHHGLESVIYHLQTDMFARLRCGIASSVMPGEKSRMKDFVLERFAPSELPSMNTMITRARDACVAYVTDGIEQTMNRFNTKQTV